MTAKRSTVTRRRRRIAVMLATLMVSLTGLVATGPPATAQAGPDPVLFVHGWNSSSSAFNTMVSRFQNAGYPSSHLMAISYNTSQSNRTTADQIASAVATLRSRTGASRVDIIAHSMGSLNTRYYVKFRGGTSYVDEWVSLGGPNHGTNTAYLCWPFQTSCREMTPGSGVLNELNSGDETPGTVRYGTWWSPCDDVINPDDSVILSGATNTRTACIGHSDLRTNATVFNQVLNFVS